MTPGTAESAVAGAAGAVDTAEIAAGAARCDESGDVAWVRVAAFAIVREPGCNCVRLRWSADRAGGAGGDNTAGGGLTDRA